MKPDTTTFKPLLPHGDIRQLFPDVFFVTGTNKILYDGSDIQTSRNMTIVRSGSALTLINTVRLNDEGLQKISSLGEVKNIVRIGAFHDRDDAFYKHQYPNAQLWTLIGVSYDDGLVADRTLVAGGEMPFPDCSLFIFEIRFWFQNLFAAGFLLGLQLFYERVRVDHYPVLQRLE